MNQKIKQKPYWEMNTQELAEATKEFDEEFVIDKCKPLSPEMRARWERAKRKVGRPKQGRGAQVISVSVEKELLARSDALAREIGITRAALIARGLKAVLAAQGQTA
jgi:cell envelope opacity-associated protein A